jgi:membrane-bound lytic murein transglycosylase MltF
MRHRLIALICLPLALMAGWSFASPNPVQSEASLPAEQLSKAEEDEVDAMVLPVPEAWVGDFDGMRERRLVRILVPYSKTYFMVDRGHQSGLAYEFGKALELWLNKQHPFERKSLRWQVMFIPVARNELLPKLLSGEGDLAGGGLTITEGRLGTVDFAPVGVKGINEAIVTGPNGPVLSRLEDLSGREVMVRASSSYHEHLLRLNERLREQGLEPVDIVPASEVLETEDLLEMVNAGVVEITVADLYIAELWQPLFTELKIHKGFYLHEGGEASWALRKGSPLLMKELARFQEGHMKGTSFGNQVLKKYGAGSKLMLNSTAEAEMRKFKELAGLFEKHAATYDFDHLMLMAQGFQESQLNQAARSPRGAVGVMQLLPSTAADPTVGIQGIEASPDRNIEAGSKYMRLLADKYLNDPEITPLNRTLMSFAAYNAGPGNLRKFRRLALKSGLDPNVWFGNVEHAAARIVGRETVDYVGNIYKYYVAYKLVAEKQEQRAASKKQL